MFLGQIKGVPLFSGLKRRHLELIQSECREVFVPDGSVILRQDEQSTDLYFILDGGVRVTLMSAEGKEVTLAVMKKGDFFGELSLFDRKPRSANVFAIADTKLLKLTRESIFGIIKENPDLSINLLSEAAGRLRRADDTIMTLSFLDVCGRVAKALIETAAGGERLKGGLVRLPGLTHRDIAEQIGSSREAVTKALKSLVQNGQIKMEGKSIIIAPKQLDAL